MAVDLVAGGFAPDGAVTHHDAPDRRVPDQEARVDRQRAVEASQPARERLPREVEAGLEGGKGHALDAREHRDDVLRGARVDRCERESAVAADDGRDAVQARRCRERVPQDLRVVVRVHVDEAGRDDQAAGVDPLRRRLVDRPRRCHGDDASVADGDVGPAPGGSGAVDRRFPRRPARRACP